MDLKYIRDFLKACQEAKKIVERIPELPLGIKPRHIHVIDAIYTLGQKKEYVKVSDISETLNVTKPSITRLINELEEKAVLIKQSQAYDNRVTTLTLTPLGEEYYSIYVDEFHEKLSELLVGVSEEELRITTKTISQVYEIMKTKE